MAVVMAVRRRGGTVDVQETRPPSNAALPLTPESCRPSLQPCPRSTHPPLRPCFGDCVQSYSYAHKVASLRCLRAFACSRTRGTRASQKSKRYSRRMTHGDLHNCSGTSHQPYADAPAYTSAICTSNCVPIRTRPSLSPVASQPVRIRSR
ncbi:hypothetical protein BC567DRAFT_39459 [Phyllosticta citribraziliensis]